MAIDGGDPVRTAPFPPRDLLSDEEKQAAVRAIGGTMSEVGYGGDEEIAYCDEFAQFMGGGYVDAVNSGTAALYVALKALQIEPFGEVIVSPITDPGGVMPVPLLNLIPVPADTLPRDFNTGPEQIEARLTKRTRAIVVAHIAGRPVDMYPIMEIARARGIPVVEDCAQSHGARYHGQLVGTIGDVGVFSTMAGKHHTTGGQGGIVFTRDEDLYWRVRRSSDRGKPIGLPQGATYATAALNLNLSDLGAAIGRVQLRKLPDIIGRRQAFAQALADACADLKAVKVQLSPPDCEGVFWFMTIEVDASRLTISKSRFVEAVAAEGIPVADRYVQAFSHFDWYINRDVFGARGLPWTAPQYTGDPDAVYDLPNCDAVDDCVFRLAMHERCGDEEVSDTVAALAKIEDAYAK
ncbi:MAG: hypothetical protein CMJ49_04260 [Planctomycetaceae bacterium]|nr:hypothetical protein [Planctomycetaceae bacterium]